MLGLLRKEYHLQRDAEHGVYMKCRHCGSENSAGRLFCTYCTGPLGWKIVLLGVAMLLSGFILMIATPTMWWLFIPGLLFLSLGWAVLDWSSVRGKPVTCMYCESKIPRDSIYCPSCAKYLGGRSESR